MKFARKMVLIPEESQDIVNNDSEQGEKASLTKQINEFKEQISRVLNDPNKSSEEKYLLYSQLFSRYLNLEQERKQPTRLILETNQTNPKEIEKKTDSIDWYSPIIESMPKTKRLKAKLLIEHLNKNNKSIRVNEIGEIIVDNKRVPNSHIVDLINDFTRGTKNSVPPTGSKAFAKALQDTNIPKTIIGNFNRIEMLSQNPRKRLFNSDSKDDLTLGDSEFLSASDNNASYKTAAIDKKATIKAKRKRKLSTSFSTKKYPPSRINYTPLK